MAERVYDVVLYGASGFVGQQTVEYFAQRAAGVRWAIAGRNPQKLAAVTAALGIAVDVLVAESQDAVALSAIAAQTRVVLSTAGPFALYGTPLVAACVQQQTHYVDITGETPWVKTLIDRYHAQTAAEGTRIIPCCGFDSIPSDLGAYLLVRYGQQAGVPIESVKAYFQLAGGLNGGTLASALNLYDAGVTAQVADPFLLNPPASRRLADRDRHRDPLTPHFDNTVQTWVAPFFMGPVNTRIVRRTQALFEDWQESYGAEFAYQEYLKFDPPAAGLQAIATTAGLGLGIGLLQYPWGRSLLAGLLPQPGSGPSVSTMDQGWFTCELVGTAADGRQVRGMIRDQGDPGNRATVKFVCEAALSLALPAESLPGGVGRGGILTPATGLGEVLATRLRQAGMTITIPTTSG